MATINRTKRVSHRQLGPYKRYELLTGEIVYAVRGYTGYGDHRGKDLVAFTSDEMIQDWEDNRDELLDFWASGESTATLPDYMPWLLARGRPGTVPWAARQFDE